jgi:acetyl-CoA carboxylase biotin carboxyl carrier protein
MEEKLIFSLIDKFNESDAVEFEYTDGQARLCRKKACGGTQASGMGGYAAVEKMRVDNVADGRDAPALSAPQGAGAVDNVHDDGEVISSPIVAAFYSSNAPDAPPFVQKGSRIRKGDTLCVLEAMKTMNKLDAEFDCEILDVLNASGDLVEYGQPLFRVKRI